MATIKEVARRARVSVGTVSNVMRSSTTVSPKLRERVLSAIRDLSYHPDHVARSLKLRQTMMLGLIISDITNPFFSQLVRGAEDAALEHNYLLLTFNTDDKPEREKHVLSVLRSRRVDGILLVVAPDEHGYLHITQILEWGIPIVCLDRVPPRIKVDSVTVDNVKASQDCVRHLIEKGHRRIGIITGSLSLPNARQRLRGYEKALIEGHIGVDRGLVWQANFRAEGGYQAAKELLANPNRPSALFVSNAMMALGVLKAVEELGVRCPEELALAVFDDIPLGELLRPPLTCVAQPAYLMGYRGAELLIQRLAAKTAKKEASKCLAVRLPTELKIRESSACSQVLKGRSAG
jgi:LacI family transcriptional regulator